MYINSEFALLSQKGPDQDLYRAITKKYAANIPIQSFGQMGFLVGKFTTAALLSIKGPVTKASYNKAAVGLKNQKSDILCKPFYVGKLAFHIPNNTNIIVDYKGGNVVVRTGCTDFPAVDKAISQTRAWEKKFHLNGG